MKKSRNLFWGTVFLIVLILISGAYLTIQNKYQLAAVKTVAIKPPTLYLKVLVLDKINRSVYINTQVKEATDFVNKFFGIKMKYTIVNSSFPHGFTKYNGCSNDATSTCTVVVNQQDLAPSARSLLTDADVSALFWNSAPYIPLQAGSTWGPSTGISNHPYITIPVDIWWYLDKSQIGFTNRGSQILTHELVNSLYTIAESKPSICKNIPTTDTGLASYGYESSRLKNLYSACGYDFLSK